MSLSIVAHEEFSAGPLHNFGFELIQFQTKVILGNMIKNFFDAKVRATTLTMPSIMHYQNTATQLRMDIRRDFPFFERKLPFIATTIVNSSERGTHYGADDYLFSETYSDSNNTVYEEDKCAGMRDLSVAIVIAARSPEDRMNLVDLLTMCFSHYYKWVYHYKGPGDDYFNIVPTTQLVKQGGETEVTDESKMSLIYVSDLTLYPLVEYIFTDHGVQWEFGVQGDIEVTGSVLKP